MSEEQTPADVVSAWGRIAAECRRTILARSRFSDYEEKVLKHAFYPNRGANLAYATLGLTGEAGEVANIVKKIQRDDGGVITDEKREKVKDELGDVLWYTAACADEIGLSLAEIAEYNAEKLAARHGADETGRVTGGNLEPTRENRWGGMSGRTHSPRYIGDEVKILTEAAAADVAVRDRVFRGHPKGSHGVITYVAVTHYPVQSRYRISRVDQVGQVQSFWYNEDEIE